MAELIFKSFSVIYSSEGLVVPLQHPFFILKILKKADKIFSRSWKERPFYRNTPLLPIEIQVKTPRN